MALDINSVLPSSFNVRFPYANAPIVPSYYLSLVPITQKGLTLGFEDLVGNGWAWLVHDSMPALYNANGDLTAPTTKVALDKLASQMATDFWNWRMFSQDVVYNGICALQPTGYDQIIEWSYTGDDAFTRVIGNPMNGEPEEFGHAATAHSGNCATQSQVAWGDTLATIPAAGGGEPGSGPARIHIGPGSDGANIINVTVNNPYTFPIPNATRITVGRWNCGWLILGVQCPAPS